MSTLPEIFGSVATRVSSPRPVLPASRNYSAHGPRSFRLSGAARQGQHGEPHIRGILRGVTRAADCYRELGITRAFSELAQRRREGAECANLLPKVPVELGPEVEPSLPGASPCGELLPLRAPMSAGYLRHLRWLSPVIAAGSPLSAAYRS